jgi:hypothetical protein
VKKQILLACLITACANILSMSNHDKKIEKTPSTYKTEIITTPNGTKIEKRWDEKRPNNYILRSLKEIEQETYILQELYVDGKCIIAKSIDAPELVKKLRIDKNNLK